MKLYKFRPLSNDEDYNRLRIILETGFFRCSSFNNQNDPMEGVFLSNGNDDIGDILRGKLSYKICSFSGEDGFKNPVMRCHYANSFKGVAIEIDINPSRIKKISYEKNTQETGDIKKILTTKSQARKYEDEYRFIEESKKSFHKIGKITGIYFGNAYHNINNRDEVTKYNTNIKEYQDFKEKIINNLDNLKIKTFDVFVENSDIKIKKC